MHAGMPNKHKDITMIVCLFYVPHLRYGTPSLISYSRSIIQSSRNGLSKICTLLALHMVDSEINTAGNEID